MSKHLTLSDRITISVGLQAQKSIHQIADELGKNRSTISREIRQRAIPSDKKPAYRIANRCVHRSSCDIRHLCHDKPNCTRKCSTCGKCNQVCPNYSEEKCPQLSRPPYVCNGCSKQSSCVLMHLYYNPEKADKAYRDLLHEARKGYNMTTSELRNIDQKVSPLIKNGHSIHHAFVVEGDNLTVSERTVSRLIKDCQLSATVMDQPRVVKLKLRKSKKNAKKVDRRCREGRAIEDFRQFLENHPGMAAVEMDSVIGEIGGKSLLTLIFPQSELMLAFLCDCHTAACVQAKIDHLYEGLGEQFHSLFPVILTDNGSEFSNPSALETAPDGTQRTNIFYCDPMASWQKPHVERNHEFIRSILPKGSSFNHLTQAQIGLVMSHINSYARPSLGDRSPFEVFRFLHGDDTLQKLLHLVWQTEIEPAKIILKPSLLR